MTTALTAWINGVGLIAPGLPDWPAARAVLRGEQAWVRAPSVLPAPPPPSRRSPSATVRSPTRRSRWLQVPPLCSIPMAIFPRNAR